MQLPSAEPAHEVCSICFFLSNGASHSLQRNSEKHGEDRGGHAAAPAPHTGLTVSSRDGGTEQAGRFRARRVVLVTVLQPEEVLVVNGLRASMEDPPSAQPLALACAAAEHAAAEGEEHSR